MTKKTHSLSHLLTLVILVAALTLTGAAQSSIGNNLDHGPTLPTTCKVGQTYFLTAVQGGNAIGVYQCTVANTFSAVGGVLTGHSVSTPLSCVAASTSGTAYTCTTSPTFVPASGDSVLFKADVANTGAATLNVNSSAAKSITKQGGGTALVANDLIISQNTLLVYDGTNWQMQGQLGINGGGSSVPFAGVPSGSCNPTGVAVNTLTSDIYTCKSSAWVLNSSVSTNTGLPQQSAIIGYYNMIDCTSSACPDTSGAANNGTIVNGPLTVGTQAASFASASTQSVTLPVAINSWKSVLMCADFQQATLTGAQRIILGVSEASRTHLNIFFSPVGDTNTTYATPVALVANNTTSTLPNETMMNTGCFIYVADASTDHIYFGPDGHESVSYQVQAGNLAKVGGTGYSIGNAPAPGFTLPWNGNIYLAIFWNTELGANDASVTMQAVNTILGKRGVLIPPKANTSATNIVVGTMDSLTQGTGGATGWPSLLSLQDTITAFNFGINGNSLCTTATALQERDAYQRINNMYNPRAGENIAVVWGGTNDLASGATAITTFDCMAAVINRWKTFGFKVIAVDMISRTGLDTQKNSLAAIFRRKCLSVADSCVDLTADPNIGADATNTNANFQSDHVHLITGVSGTCDGTAGETATGQNLVACYLSQAINQVAMVHSAGVPSIICSNAIPVTVNANVATDQLLMACTIQAGVLNKVYPPNKILHVEGYGVYSTPAASTSVITVKAKLCTVSGCGSGTVVTLASYVTAALGTLQATNDPFNFTLESLTSAVGASATFEAHGNLNIDLAAAAATAATIYPDNNTAVSSTIDATAQLFLQITGAFSNASASNSMTQRSMVVRTED